MTRFIKKMVFKVHIFFVCFTICLYDCNSLLKNDAMDILLDKYSA